jgi:excisionase family DNA binding protein
MKPTKNPHQTHLTDDPLLDIREAAALLALQPATLRRWTFTRRIPSVRLGLRAVRYRRSELLRFIAAGERPALRPIDGR